ncbi:hypothetical protein D0962_14000 [Leptolyngbyaceae cyanobacterium CCMR0082]|uniref:Glycine-rich domain-containing protein-like n=1 Tax=Adonisia turfae CCMR0082 TaxID=2304604 RepID=A0A6M0S676_9CYAN|nr:hypothetical protein [Adonisia turfae CCMR0082]
MHTTQQPRMNSQQAELYKRLQIYALDQPGAQFSFSQRLAQENCWSFKYTCRVIEEYKRFAFLAVVAGHPVTPSDQVDQVWHLHLTYTRSYWEDFCPNVLQMSLHHEPTQGGGVEHDKFLDWYSRTLASYRQLFGEEPPRDIWPEPGERFGQELEFVRVNLQRNWLLPKLGIIKTLKCCLQWVRQRCWRVSRRSIKFFAS